VKLFTFLPLFSRHTLLRTIGPEKLNRLSVKKITGGNQKEDDTDNRHKRRNGKEETLIIKIIELMKARKHHKYVIDNAHNPPPVSYRIDEDTAENTDRCLYEGYLTVKRGSGNYKKCPAAEQEYNGNLNIAGKKIKGTLFHHNTSRGNAENQ
jgi:hypothetical protein